MYIYSWKKMKNIWPILVILYVKSRFVIIARGVQLDNGVDPPCTYYIISTKSPGLELKTGSQVKQIIVLISIWESQ